MASTFAMTCYVLYRARHQRKMTDLGRFQKLKTGRSLFGRLFRRKQSKSFVLFYMVFLLFFSTTSKELDVYSIASNDNNNNNNNSNFPKDMCFIALLLFQVLILIESLMNINTHIIRRHEERPAEKPSKKMQYNEMMNGTVKTKKVRVKDTTRRKTLWGTSRTNYVKLCERRKTK